MKKALSSFLTMESIILSFLLGAVLILWEGVLLAAGEHAIHDPISETLAVAIYLVILVGQSDFKIPVFGKGRWTVFSLCFIAGLVSMFFDSFAVVLFVAAMKFSDDKREGDYGTLQFRTFFIKVIASLNALTVGGAFYIGELWGLPHYISSGMDVWYAGLPLLVVLVPFSIATSLLATFVAPALVQRPTFGQEQVVATLEIVFFLGLIIVTHAPILCLGVFLVYAGLRARTPHVLKKFAHELESGAAIALSLVFVALIISSKLGWGEQIGAFVGGWKTMLLAAVSSPFAGAVIPGSATPHEFFVNISWLMMGAPLFVSSSLVAIMVFREHVAYTDLPEWVQSRVQLSGESRLQEAFVYSVVVLPLQVVLGIMLWIGNSTEAFVALYNMLA